jgi:hypothetical protein
VSPAVGMNCAGKQLLAGSGFPGYEHGGITPGGSQGTLKYWIHAGRIADNLFEAMSDIRWARQLVEAVPIQFLPIRRECPGIFHCFSIQRMAGSDRQENVRRFRLGSGNTHELG